MLLPVDLFACQTQFKASDSFSMVSFMDGYLLAEGAASLNFIETTFEVPVTDFYNGLEIGVITANRFERGEFYLATGILVKGGRYGGYFQFSTLGIEPSYCVSIHQSLERRYVYLFGNFFEECQDNLMKHITLLSSQLYNKHFPKPAKPI